KRGRLQNRADIDRAAVELPATLYAFDLIELLGFDLRGLPLVERKAVLAAMLPAAGPIKLSEHIAERGKEMFASAEALGLEGIVAKRADSKYVGRRSTDWIKVTAAKRDDFVVVGFTREKNGRGLGALLLGQYRNGVLTYVGRAGTGFSARELRELHAALDALPRAKPPANAPPARGATWIAAGPVAEVEFKNRTTDGLLRQPVFLRLRDDKSPEECVADDEPLDPPEPPPTAAPARTVALTNVDKVFWPDEGWTKGDLIAYYDRVAPWLLPYLRDRP